MATSQMNRVIQHLHQIRPDDSRPTDGQLLEAYLRCRDDTAVATLVRRHGPMVWGVCRRVLRHHQDAEDAFQATFLVLHRKAASIGTKELLANWLHGTARLTALKARARAARRNERERQVPDMPEPPSTRRIPGSDVRPALDEELSRLPNRYRAVIVLCDLEGCTRKEAARQLGCPEGTVASRLTRARAMLAKRLRRRGVVLFGGTSAVLEQQSVSAFVPNSVVDSTIHSARLLASGKAAAAAIPVRVTALSEDVMKTMLLTKLKAAVAVVLVFGFAVTGTTILAGHKAAGSDENEPATKKHGEPAGKREKVTDEEDVTAWGKEVGGLQAGLSVRNRSDIQTGGKVAAVVRLRNVSTETITVSAWPMWVTGPRVVDTQGKPVRATSPPTPLFSVLPTSTVSSTPLLVLQRR
jgi:RNA polymerase sigma factor (sigma-70 family)